MYYTQLKGTTYIPSGMHDNVLHTAQGDYLYTYKPSGMHDNVLHIAQGDYL